MDFLQTPAPFRFIHPMSLLSGTVFFQPASAAWPSANRAVFTPICLQHNFVLRRFFIANGATVSGHFDVGIYTPDGQRIASSGSIAQAGVSDLQYASPAAGDTILRPGAYYLALAIDNTTATIMRSSTGAGDARAFGFVQQDSAFTLPATATFAAMTAGYGPFLGITSTSSGF
jgi:hypothetical protein